MPITLDEVENMLRITLGQLQHHIAILESRIAALEQQSRPEWIEPDTMIGPGPNPPDPEAFARVAAKLTQLQDACDHSWTVSTINGREHDFCPKCGACHIS